MTDILSPPERSALMRRIKGRDTLPERLVSQELSRLGVAHRTNAADLPGTPDIALDGIRVAIFVHGCFWHGCPLHYRPPDTRREWWVAKMQRTRRRDKAARLALMGLGWKAVEIWEHQLKENLKEAVAAALQQKGKGIPPRGRGKAVNRYDCLRRSSSIGICRRALWKKSEEHWALAKKNSASPPSNGPGKRGPRPGTTK